MLTIPSHKNDDPNYRYKMPRLVAKVEGRGNGIRTNIVNMGDIARALKRPAEYPTKFCGYELGAMSKFESNEGKAIVNGAHEQRDLQALIDKFIDKFVLCHHCALPEIDLQLRKGKVSYRCNACGDVGEVDNAHKLATFILKNPPDGGDSTMGKHDKKNGKKGAKKKKDDAEDNANSVTAEFPSVLSGELGDVLDPLAITEKKKSSKKKKKKSSNDGDAAADADEDGDSSSGKKHRKEKDKKKKTAKADKEKAVKQRVKEEEAERAAASNYDSDNIKSILQVMLDWAAIPKPENNEVDTAVLVKSQKSVASSQTQEEDADSDAPEITEVLREDMSAGDFYEQLNLLRITRGVTQRAAFYVLLCVLFSKERLGRRFDMPTFHAKFNFVAFMASKMLPRDVLSGLEDFIARQFPESFKRYPYVLQKFYDADILDEKSILRYYSSSKKAKEARESHELAKTAAAPFLNWLAEDNSDASSSEEEA